MFDSILGLPVHPLAVHLPVVLLPLVSIGLIVLAFKPAWRPRYATLALIALVIAAIGTLVAVLSGLALAARVGLPVQHRTLGISTAIAAGVLLIVGGMWLMRVRRRTERDKSDDTVGWVVAALGVIVMVLVGLTGHSGATATWGDVVTGDSAVPAVGGSATPASTGAASTPASGESTPAAEPSASAQESEAPSDEPTDAVPSPTDAAAGITMADVEANNTAESCWAAINGTVYDLTDWIAQHPGGADRILALCGTDATSAFTNQHSGDDEPQQRLRGFEIGPLA